MITGDFLEGDVAICGDTIVGTNSQYDGKGLKIWISAIRKIKKGEEITCDYGFGFDKDYKQFPCKCRSKNCCGYIVREESRWRIHKKYSMSNKKINK